MTKHEKVIAYMDEFVEEYIRLEPREDFDPCIVGVGRRFTDTVLIYSTQKIVDMLVAQGSDPEEADEHFEYNIIGGWLGSGTPIFLQDAAFYEDLVGDFDTPTNPASTEQYE